MDLLNKILAHILGNKYYANIINTRGTGKCEISCFIFHTPGSRAAQAIPVRQPLIHVRRDNLFPLTQAVLSVGAVL